MSNFDDIFEQKLNEEQSFPNPEANWGKLATQLQSHDLLVHAVARKLLIWKIAAAAALIATVATTGILYQSKQENRQLQATIAQLEEKLATPSVPIATGSSSEIPKQTHETLPESDPAKAVIPNKTDQASNSKALPGKVLNANEITPTKARSKNNKPGIVSKANDMAVSNPPVEGQKSNRDLQETALNAAQQTIAQLQARVDTLEQTLATIKDLPLQPKTLAILDPLPAFKKQTVAKTISPETVAMHTSLIHPIRVHDRFRVGIQTQLGFLSPKAKGVTPLKGSGISAAFSPARNFWITASADWLHFDIQSDTFLKRFRLPNPPMINPNHTFDKLVHMETSQRQQQFALGIKYALPVRARIRPTLRLAHIWTRVAPGTVSFRFEEPFHPGGPHQNDPEYYTIRTAARSFGNTWRMGAGLERSFGRWNLAVSADYAKHFVERAFSYDAVFVNLGLQYSIF
jgi:BMFP domain-containing protein YqiC